MLQTLFMLSIITAAEGEDISPPLTPVRVLQESTASRIEKIGIFREECRQWCEQKGVQVNARIDGESNQKYIDRLGHAIHEVYRLEISQQTGQTYEPQRQDEDSQEYTDRIEIPVNGREMLNILNTLHTPTGPSRNDVARAFREECRQWCEQRGPSVSSRGNEESNQSYINRLNQAIIETYRLEIIQQTGQTYEPQRQDENSQEYADRIEIPEDGREMLNTLNNP